MGLTRKIISASTLGAVDFRSDKERTARYTKQTRNAVRGQNKAHAQTPTARPEPATAVDWKQLRSACEEIAPLAHVGTPDPLEGRLLMNANVLFLDGKSRVRWWTLAKLTGIEVVERPGGCSAILMGGADHPSIEVNMSETTLRQRMAPYLAAAGKIAPTRSSPIVVTPATTGLVDEIERLAGLHERGLLTADEFAVAKAQLLRPASNVPVPDDKGKTVYDVSGWLPEQRAGLAAQLEEAGIAYDYDGDDLLVPGDREAETDALLDRIASD